MALVLFGSIVNALDVIMHVLLFEVVEPLFHKLVLSRHELSVGMSHDDIAKLDEAFIRELSRIYKLIWTICVYGAVVFLFFFESCLVVFSFSLHL